MEILYRNSDNTKIIDFSGGSYEISDIDVFRHEFQYIVENEKITEFKKRIGYQHGRLRSNRMERTGT